MPDLHFKAPAYCSNCGSPFPWTQSGIEAAQELADELEELSREEKTALKTAIVDLTKSGPRAQLSQSRFKKIMSKVGKESAQVMRSLVVDIVSEVVRKSLYGI